MRKKYRVFDGEEAEGQVMWLTPAEVVEWRRKGYYVEEMS